eukprot:scpid88905/ scgid10947/ 
MIVSRESLPPCLSHCHRSVWGFPTKSQYAPMLLECSSLYVTTRHSYYSQLGSCLPYIRVRADSLAVTHSCTAVIVSPQSHALTCSLRVLSYLLLPLLLLFLRLLCLLCIISLAAMASVCRLQQGFRC